MKKQNLLKAMLMSIILCASSSSFADDYASLKDNPCIDDTCQYQNHFASLGCSQIAWENSVNAYNNSMTNHNTRVIKSKDDILGNIINPGDMGAGGGSEESCLEDAKGLWEEIKSGYEDIKGQVERLKSPGFTYILDGLIGKIIEKIKEKAEEACQDAVNQGGEVLKTGTSIVKNAIKNPFDTITTHVPNADKAVSRIRASENALGVEYGSYFQKIEKNSSEKYGGNTNDKK